MISISFLILFLFSTISLSADENITVDIVILDQPAQFRNNRPKIVAGLWHILTFEGISEKNTALTLSAYKGTSIPSEKNATNFYQWEYTPLVTTPWQQTTPYGNQTINPSRSEIGTRSVTFCVGIPDRLPGTPFYNEEWTVELSTIDRTLFKDSIYLEKPTRGFAKSRGDRLSFSVDPFTEMIANPSDYLTLKNTGNVPLNITIDFKTLNNLLSYTESSNQISANDEQNYRLELNAQSWKPQRISQRGDAKALVSNHYLLDEDTSGTTISLQTALVIDVPTINIFVGHRNYELTTLDEFSGFSFQHQRTFSMNEGETRTIHAYLSGEGTATVSIQVDNNVSLIQLTRNNLPAQSPLTIISTNNEEQVIGVQIKALSENRNGLITYTLETGLGTRSFTTRINVGPPAITQQPTSFGATSTVTIVVLLALISAASIMLYNHLSYGRRQRR
ncbi:MAG: hypothetical protein QCI00_00530 [Candidatus Thermoplasmatota archaeon]|nr:hypothetical protein [Candidatus Thermoplasmatota archaeon]